MKMVQLGSNFDSVRNFFEHMKQGDLLSWKKTYINLLAIEKDPSSRIPKMPWMIAPWEDGLRILNEVIEKRMPCAPV